MGKYKCPGCGKTKDSKDTSQLWFEFDPGYETYSFDYEDTYGHACADCIIEVIENLSEHK